MFRSLGRARKLGLLLSTVLITAALLPGPAAAVGPGGLLHGGKPSVPVNVTCALNVDEYDVLATVDPDLVVEAFANGIPVALAWQKTSSKLSAPALFLDELNTSAIGPTNFVFGEDLAGEGYPFVWVLVQFGYVDQFTLEFVILGSGTGKCKVGDLAFV